MLSLKRNPLKTLLPKVKILKKHSLANLTSTSEEKASFTEGLLSPEKR
jgi:hypothetical protein